MAHTATPWHLPVPHGTHRYPMAHWYPMAHTSTLRHTPVPHGTHQYPMAHWHPMAHTGTAAFTRLRPLGLRTAEGSCLRLWPAGSGLPQAPALQTCKLSANFTRWEQGALRQHTHTQPPAGASRSSRALPCLCLSPPVVSCQMLALEGLWGRNHGFALDLPVPCTMGPGSAIAAPTCYCHTRK